MFDISDTDYLINNLNIQSFDMLISRIVTRNSAEVIAQSQNSKRWR